jgi:hypothetical protein
MAHTWNYETAWIRDYPHKREAAENKLGINGMHCNPQHWAEGEFPVEIEDNATATVYPKAKRPDEPEKEGNAVLSLPAAPQSQATKAHTN